MAYSNEYWQALYELQTISIKMNRKANEKQYARFTYRRTNNEIVWFHAAFNSKSSKFSIVPCQAVNLQFNEYNSDVEPIFNAKIDNLADDEKFVKEYVKEKQIYKYWIIRPIDINMSKTNWVELREEQRTNFLHWHNQKLNQLKGIL